ncbi:MAG TPA: HAD hydrolase-like protein [Gemmatales bacterium]|nr:HAD hydrolase-like protein [Gemmatales bacterium]
MPQTLAKYIESLHARKDLLWPEPPAPEPLKAKPHLKPLPSIRAVSWSVYGTLLPLPLGELVFEHPTKFVMDVALDKTIQEFRMWKSMTRKPGPPADHMRVWLGNVIDDLKFQTPAGEKHPELGSHLIWAGIVKKLMTNEYIYSESQLGDLEEYGAKIAYFYHAMLQGVGPMPEAIRTILALNDLGKKQAIAADGQQFSWEQLHFHFRSEAPGQDFSAVLPQRLQSWSIGVGARKPSERLFRAMLATLRAEAIDPSEVLHVGTHLYHDVAPARKLGMRTALFAGDKTSLRATKEDMREPHLRPDVLLTRLSQIVDILTP